MSDIGILSAMSFSNQPNNFISWSTCHLSIILCLL
jgi:hypothetical protein